MNRPLLAGLVLSLAANATLLGAWLWRPRATNPVPSAIAAALEPEVAPHRDAAPPDAITGGTSAAADADTGARYADLKALVARLRAGGYPDDLIRALVQSTLNERQAARRRAFFPTTVSAEYWKAERRSTSYDAQITAQYRELAAERQAVLTELFGDGASDTETARRSQRARWGNLPDAKLAALERINSDYSELSASTRASFGDSSGGLPLPWEREQLELIEQEKRADLEALLAPHELEIYDLHTSNTANSLRSQLAYFQPTEQEFLALYRLQQPFDAIYRPSIGSPTDPTTARRRATEQQQLEEQFRSALGEARYADYRRARDQGFVAAARVTERLKLPLANAHAVYDLQQEMQPRIAATRGDRALTTEQRNAALAALSREALDKLTPLLSAQGAEAYKQSAGWLRMLEPRSTPPSIQPRSAP